MYHGVGICCGSPIVESKMFKLKDAVTENAFNSLNNKKRKPCAKNPKLELYVDILIVLIHNGSLNLMHIMHEGNFSSFLMKENMCFLIRQNLVEAKLEKGEIIYSITPSGVRVLKYFGKTTGLLSVVQINK